MKMRIKATMTGSAFLLLSLFLLASCGGGGGGAYGGGGGGGTPPSSTVQIVACPVTADATVDAVTATAFNPVGVPITVNQIVRWNNVTGFDHTVTSDTVPTNGAFNVGLLNNTSVCLMFTAAGTFNYHCVPHPNMTGSVTVTP